MLFGRFNIHGSCQVSVLCPRAAAAVLTLSRACVHCFSPSRPRVDSLSALQPFLSGLGPGPGPSFAFRRSSHCASCLQQGSDNIQLFYHQVYLASGVNPTCFSSISDPAQLHQEKWQRLRHKQLPGSELQADVMALVM